MNKTSFIAAILIFIGIIFVGGAVGGMDYGEETISESAVRAILGIIFTAAGLILARISERKEE